MKKKDKRKFNKLYWTQENFLELKKLTNKNNKTKESIKNNNNYHWYDNEATFELKF